EAHAVQFMDDGVVRGGEWHVEPPDVRGSASPAQVCAREICASNLLKFLAYIFKELAHCVKLVP
ncbi:MAG: hypothetical protein FWE15_15750, partial [Actinomycetia bacterium]|nr:hypothetical protein [Actinomycetes bacterium]